MPARNSPLRTATVAATFSLLYPAIVGLIVRQYLVARGAPVLGVSNIAGMVPVLAVGLTVANVPFFLVAYWAQAAAVARSPWAKPLWEAYVGGLVGSTVFFADGWRDPYFVMEIMVLIPIAPWLFSVTGMLLGFGLGALLHVLPEKVMRRKGLAGRQGFEPR